MKSIIYFCIVFLIVMTVYYTSFSKDEKVQLTIFTNEGLNNFADNTSKLVNNVTDKSVSIVKDGYNTVVAKFQNDNSSKPADSIKPTTDNGSKSEVPVAVADNESFLKVIDSIVQSVSDNISKTVIMFGEYINKNMINQDNGSNITATDNGSINEDNATTK